MNITKVSKFQTTDNRLFDNEVKAIKHQMTIDLVAVAKKLLPNNNIGRDEYIQLTREQYDAFKDTFDTIIEECHPDLVERNPTQHARGSFIGRLLSDYDSPAYNLWWIFECVDSRLRMYNQPYYANHPAETANFKRVDTGE